jgi:hypothetical protein
MKHAPAWLSAATADKAMAFTVAAGVLLVIILLASAVRRLSKGSAPVPAPAPKKSGAGGSFLIAVAAAVGGWLLWKHHAPAAGTAKAAPAPSPVPTVTTTVTPHPVTHFVMPHLSGGVVIGISVVAIVLLGPLLRRSS